MLTINNKVSILMPVKDAALYLSDCLHSILKQTYSNWELIAVDDHSIDDSYELLKGFEKDDERIKILKNNGNGIVDSISQAFESSNGEFIHRMDADDIMSLEKLEILVKTLGERTDAIATANVKYFSDKTVSQGYLAYENWINNIEDYSAEVYRECTIASPNWLVHRSSFEKVISLSKLEYPEDYDLVLKWHAQGFEVLKSNSVTHLWREHPARTSRNSDIYQQESFFRLKLKHFCQNELKDGEQIQIVGAGKKGKLVKTILQELNVDHKCFDMNLNRVSSNIDLFHLSDLNPTQCALLTNWPADMNLRGEIDAFMKAKLFKRGENFWIL